MSMTFDASARDGVKDATRSYFEDLILPYTTAGEIGGGGGGDGGEFFLGRTGIGESGVNVRGRELGIIGAEDVFLSSSSFTSCGELSSGGFLEWSGMDSVPKFDGSKWTGFGTCLAGSFSGANIESECNLGRETERQGSFSAFGRSDYVADSSEPVRVDDSFSLSMAGKVDFETNSGMSISNYDECGDCFMDGNWIPDSNFEDPEGIFSDSIFWDGGISKLEGDLRQTDSLSETQKTLSGPDGMNAEMIYAENSRTYMDGKTVGKRSHFEDDKKSVGTLSPGEHANIFSNFNSRNGWTDMEYNKIDMQSPPLKSRRVERTGNESVKLSSMWLEDAGEMQQTGCCPSIVQSRMPVFQYQDRALREGYNFFDQGEPVEKPYFLASGPSMPSFSAVRNEHQHLSNSNIDYQVPMKQPYIMQNNGVSSGKVHLNPQEKIEKLKRRQQMQAKLAIEMQQKQLNEKMNCIRESHLHSVYSEEGRSTRSIESKFSTRQESCPEVPAVGDGCSVTESTVCQLGSVISKMDDKLKICMRDSLFRLARSASARMGVEDSNSMNITGGYEDKAASNSLDRSYLRQLKSPNSEPETNQIDRIVALLLFNRHPQTLRDFVNNVPSSHEVVDGGL